MQGLFERTSLLFSGTRAKGDAESPPYWWVELVWMGDERAECGRCGDGQDGCITEADV